MEPLQSSLGSSFLQCDFGRFGVSPRGAPCSWVTWFSNCNRAPPSYFASGKHWGGTWDELDWVLSPSPKPGVLLSLCSCKTRCGVSHLNQYFHPFVVFLIKISISVAGLFLFSISSVIPHL